MSLPADATIGGVICELCVSDIRNFTRYADSPRPRRSESRSLPPRRLRLSDVAMKWVLSIGRKPVSGSCGRALKPGSGSWLSPI